MHLITYTLTFESHIILVTTRDLTDIEFYFRLEAEIHIKSQISDLKLEIRLDIQPDTGGPANIRH